MNMTNEELERLRDYKGKVYTQDQLDDIVETSKRNYMEKVSKTHVVKTDYDMLLTEKQSLEGDIYKNSVKDNFLKRNGREDAFEDFFKVEGDNFKDLDSKKIDKFMDKVSADKQYYFSKHETSVTEHDEQLLGSMLSANGNMGNDNRDLHPGTIYKKNG